MELSLLSADIWLILAALLIAGTLSGILAGLFGIGGGAILVPVFYELFKFLGIPEAIVMPYCVGTSLAIIVPTSISSFKSHYKRGQVDNKTLKTWIVPVFIGVVLGSYVAKYAPGDLFKLIYIVIAAVVAINLLYAKDHIKLKLTMPSSIIMRLYGIFIGFFSVLMGIGGGVLTSIFMTYHGRTIHQAISTAAGIGIVVSIPGVIGFILAGWGLSTSYPELDLIQYPLAFGFVSLIGFAVVAPMSVLAAPLGVYIAHSLSRSVLEKAFGCFLLIICVRFIYSLAIFQ